MLRPDGPASVRRPVKMPIKQLNASGQCIRNLRVPASDRDKKPPYEVPGNKLKQWRIESGKERAELGRPKASYHLCTKEYQTCIANLKDG